MRYSVLLSLFDRNIVDLRKTYRQLEKAAAGRDDVEFCIVYDFEASAHNDAIEGVTKEFANKVRAIVSIERHHTLRHHPETFHINGHNNPVAVNNKLMDMATGDNLVWISSDMIVSSLIFDRIDKHLTGRWLNTVWCSRVLDQDSLTEFCGPSRPTPMMWCVAHRRTTQRHDLNLLHGFGYDDNDWMARMALAVGTIKIDLVHFAIHQTHGKVTQVGQVESGVAYTEDARPGWTASKAYMKEKWGGNPFDAKTLEITQENTNEFIILHVTGVKAGKEYPK